ncbi:MAG: hypothetical protein H8D56_08615 [Planctomycetes bacterium]|nr:hypothetical protein [Planctomycetota bacterium]
MKSIWGACAACFCGLGLADYSSARPTKGYHRGLLFLASVFGALTPGKDRVMGWSTR